jgi:molecular chaperone GrpE
MSTENDKDPKNNPWRDPADLADGTQGEAKGESQEDSYFSEDNDDIYDSIEDDSPEMLVQTLELQVAELRDRELKAQAELENFRRRILRDVDQQLKYAAMPWSQICSMCSTTSTAQSSLQLPVRAPKGSSLG